MSNVIESAPLKFDNAISSSGHTDKSKALSNFEKIIATISETVFSIEHQLNALNHPDILRRLKQVFAHNYEYDADDQSHNFEWQWRDLSRKNNEYYSSDQQDAFKDACKEIKRKFKEIVGEPTFHVCTSSEYASLSICIPETIDIVKDKRDLFKNTVNIFELREISSDKVINVESNYVVVNRDASSDFLSRLDAVIRLLGFIPVVKYREQYIQINV